MGNYFARSDVSKQPQPSPSLERLRQTCDIEPCWTSPTVPAVSVAEMRKKIMLYKPLADFTAEDFNKLLTQVHGLSENIKIRTGSTVDGSVLAPLINTYQTYLLDKRTESKDLYEREKEKLETRLQGGNFTSLWTVLEKKMVKDLKVQTKNSTRTNVTMEASQNNQYYKMLDELIDVAAAGSTNPNMTTDSLLWNDSQLTESEKSLISKCKGKMERLSHELKKSVLLRPENMDAEAQNSTIPERFLYYVIQWLLTGLGTKNSKSNECTMQVRMVISGTSNLLYRWYTSYSDNLISLMNDSTELPNLDYLRFYGVTEYEFKSHEDLNDFAWWLDSLDYFNNSTMDEYKLLKAFARGYWMEDVSNKKTNQENKENKNINWFFSKSGHYNDTSIPKHQGYNIGDLTFDLPTRGQ
ncbi:hypothetical protein C9374_014154 [Naegleria lovaniensis]|uniref:Uncharacterized protein n=1 Tax=Naegleria lovaniensis TaxID=51637 RepID=A0AA88H190_NAELO|nr:uncharacterized protein C9374_014154 [Naegleria lovaniensis]KAG2389594.1 hypothetical protein C9374_014154 [Naegleria lovaniensis]